MSDPTSTLVSPIDLLAVLLCWLAGVCVIAVAWFASRRRRQHPGRER